MAIIEDIERRLLNWARWRVGQGSGGLGYASVKLMMRVDGNQAAEAVVPTIGPEAEETDRAVMALPSELRATVECWYLANGTLVMKAARLAVHPETLKRRRWEAQRVIRRWLSDQAEAKRARAGEF